MTNSPTNPETPRCRKCGRVMYEQFTRCVDADGNAEVFWECPATPDQHRIAELEAQLAAREAARKKEKS